MRVLPLLLLAVAAPLAAQSRHDSAAPVNFGADHIELADKANRATLSGNVQVTQAEMTINAARMQVAYTGQVVGGSPQISRIDASGGVIVRRPDQTATGKFGIYDLTRRVVTMLGGVSLKQGTNTVNGARLSINLDTGRAVIDGSAVGAAAASATGAAVQPTPGGRVTGTFSVPDRSR